MKISKVLISLVFCVSFIYANPILVTYIHEVQAAPDSLERIEIHYTPIPGGSIDLSGWWIRTRDGIATINQGVVLQDSGYIAIDSTNTSGIFDLNEITDTIIFYTPQGYEVDRVYWPSLPAGWRHAPAPPYSGSISLYRPPYTHWDANRINWYIDSTPTFNQLNDNWSTISGRVLTQQGQPVANHYVVATGPNGNSSGSTDALGDYIIGGLGQGKYWLNVYYQWNPPCGNYPDSVYVGYSQNVSGINITLPLSGIEQTNHFVFSDNFISVQNPFRRDSKISFVLPYENDVLIKIYDTKGSVFKTLLNQKLNAGQHQIGLNMKLISGIYFINADIGTQRLTKKIISVD